MLAWLSPRNNADIIDENTLHRHCFSALMGVPSPTFTLHNSTYFLAPSASPIRLEDVSPAALRSALGQFSQAGTAALRISLVAAYASAPSTALPFTVKSLICFARTQLLALCQVSAAANHLQHLSCRDSALNLQSSLSRMYSLSPLCVQLKRLAAPARIHIFFMLKFLPTTGQASSRRFQSILHSQELCAKRMLAPCLCCSCLPTLHRFEGSYFF